ncbi:hypothetical protein BKA56DRAFT_278866 [Ilyonectria sp. MPI-CAGE-AT-0026]|nr:hypothetical protein BKA56DRAFT_278866 [Ilyonectria sp. MPI-CAGE-AT-0026]
MHGFFFRTSLCIWATSSCLTHHDFEKATVNFQWMQIRIMSHNARPMEDHHRRGNFPSALGIAARKYARGTSARSGRVRYGIMVHRPNKGCCHNGYRASFCSPSSDGRLDQRYQPKEEIDVVSSHREPYDADVVVLFWVEERPIAILVDSTDGRVGIRTKTQSQSPPSRQLEATFFPPMMNPRTVLVLRYWSRSVDGT